MLYAEPMAEKPKLGSLIALGVGATAIAYWKFVPDGMSAMDGLLIVVGAWTFSILYFGGIHLLLKRWDRWRGR